MTHLPTAEPCLLRYFFDTGSGVCLWAANHAARERFGYAIDPEALPLTENTRRYLPHLMAWHDISLDWSSPPDPGATWTPKEAARFQAAAARGLRLLREELAGQGVLIREEPPSC